MCDHFRSKRHPFVVLEMHQHVPTKCQVGSVYFSPKYSPHFEYSLTFFAAYVRLAIIVEKSNKTF